MKLAYLLGLVSDCSSERVDHHVVNLLLLRLHCLQIIEPVLFLHHFLFVECPLLVKFVVFLP